MKLLPLETLITESTGSGSENIYLTNIRIVQEKISSGNSKKVSINLPSITSCELKSKTRPIWFVIGLLLGFGIFFLTEEIIFAIGGLIIGTVIFFLTRSSIIYIASPTSTITFDVSGMAVESQRKFLDQVEGARHLSK